jgi:solute carrier family 27 fatty acid transporter 1/4
LKVDDYSNKIASIFLKQFKLKKGDCVALLLENKPEYIATWIGLSKIGVISALINTNLKNQPLLHSIQLAKPKCVLYGSTLEDCKIAFLISIHLINEKVTFLSNFLLYLKR